VNTISFIINNHNQPKLPSIVLNYNTLRNRNNKINGGFKK